MSSLLGFLLQFGLVLVPVCVFWLVQQRAPALPWRLLTTLGLSLATGTVAFALYAGFGWLPVTRSGRVLELSGVGLFAVFGGGVLVVLLLMDFWPQRAAR